MLTQLKMTLAGFLFSLIVNTLTALLILQPTVNEAFGIYIRKPEDGLNYPSLIGGYLIVALIMVYLFPRYQTSKPRLLSGVLLGWLVGLAVFFGGHLIIAGWSTMPTFPMVFSGFIDSFSMAFGGLGIALFAKGANKNGAIPGKISAAGARGE